MANLSLQNISKQYDYKPILSDVSLSVQEGERMAIVGKNGAGKSTLLKILSGEVEADEGSRIFQGNLEIKHLIQKPVFQEGQSVKEVILHSLEELHAELQKYPSEDIYVIGGETIYRQLLDECDVAHITKIDYAYDADAYFPNLDQMPEWEITAAGEEQSYFDTTYRFIKYTRK